MALCNRQGVGPMTDVRDTTAHSERALGPNDSSAQPEQQRFALSHPRTEPTDPELLARIIAYLDGRQKPVSGKVGCRALGCTYDEWRDAIRSSDGRVVGLSARGYICLWDASTSDANHALNELYSRIRHLKLRAAEIERRIHDRRIGIPGAREVA